MLNNDWKDYLNRAKNEYYMIKSVSCPALNNEKIFFNQHGFNHLIRKGRRQRDRDEQIIRIILLKNAPNIIGSATKYHSYRKSGKRIGNNTNIFTTHFWSFIKDINGKKVTIIIRQLGTGNKHFFSIFENHLSI